ncbi:MAG TPA: hypothetical protein VKB96_00700 [Gammaproteobacteria bacterium]|nr:hypothetical protein [Gammaproteobacteria bacterium]
MAAGPLVAHVQASGGNLNGQIKSMSMRETIDGNAIFYSREFPISN